MSQIVLESIAGKPPDTSAERPPRQHPEQTLVLSPLAPDAVVDHLDEPSSPIEMTTFGTVRECCPACQQSHLRLVLRQRRVRVAHLFCIECKGCFDAHYSSGESALTI